MAVQGSPRADRRCPRPRSAAPHPAPHVPARAAGRSPPDMPTRGHEAGHQIRERRQHERTLGRGRVRHLQPLDATPVPGRGCAPASGRSLRNRCRPKTSRSRSSSRGPQRARCCRPNERSSALSAMSNVKRPALGVTPVQHDVEADHRIVELRLVRDTHRSGGVQPRDARQGGCRAVRRARARREPGRLGASPRFAPRPRYARTRCSRRGCPPWWDDGGHGRTARRHLPPVAARRRAAARPACWLTARETGRPHHVACSSARALAGCWWSPATAIRLATSTAFGERLAGIVERSVPGAGSWCSAPGRCRCCAVAMPPAWSRRPALRRSSARPDQQSLLVGRVRLSDARRPAGTCRHCPPTTPCPAGSRRRTMSGSVSCRVASAWRSTSTRRSTSPCSAWSDGRPVPLRTLARGPSPSRGWASSGPSRPIPVASCWWRVGRAPARCAGWSVTPAAGSGAWSRSEGSRRRPVTSSRPTATFRARRAAGRARAGALGDDRRGARGWRHHRQPGPAGRPAGRRRALLAAGRGPVRVGPAARPTRSRTRGSRRSPVPLRRRRPPILLGAHTVVGPGIRCSWRPRRARGADRLLGAAPERGSLLR